MALTFELSEPTAIAAGCNLVDFSINSGPKLALTVHKVSAIWLAPCHSYPFAKTRAFRSTVPYVLETAKFLRVRPTPYSRLGIVRLLLFVIRTK